MISRRRHAWTLICLTHLLPQPNNLKTIIFHPSVNTIRARTHKPQLQGTRHQNLALHNRYAPNRAAETAGLCQGTEHWI
ncbi:hypothetical protein P171DRAFT_55179 [Karstenula rhodostoma CBS 690.94]|uniref:Uncharacterized protein n=1 Tax=Karstenula rhodostoma CBS 690.94 TaxID=1392251 RepID=A0A9P4PDI4_9PLEO|nr:hypothetical protein P171DRAFT_55179 [Karstenula rhodostoma CBS 690.94]